MQVERIFTPLELENCFVEYGFEVSPGLSIEDEIIWALARLEALREVSTEMLNALEHLGCICGHDHTIAERGSRALLSFTQLFLARNAVSYENQIQNILVFYQFAKSCGEFEKAS